MTFAAPGRSASGESAVLRAERSSYHYRGQGTDQSDLKNRTKEIAETRVRYGYRRIHVLLRREGWVINGKRVYRLYKELGSQLRRKAPRRRVKAKLREGRCAASRVNDVWAMDFVHDQLATGPKLRILTVVDTYSRFSPAVVPRFQFRAPDVTEVLEYVPGRFRVVRHVRPKLACGRCDAISQAPAPSLPIPRGRAGPNLLAHVVVSKFADHLPLYRQSRIYAREGVDLNRSTLADWLGQVSWLLQPLVDRIADHVMTSPKLHADDTPVPVLAPGTGKTATGRLWVYLRDNRRWRPSDRPAALFRYSPDRKGDHPREHLRTFASFLQADAYAGFERLYAPDRQPGLITPVACWAHARRKLHDVYKADPHSVAAVGLKLIRELYDVERGIACDPADDRRKARKLSRLRALDFFAWADGVLAQISARSPLAEALRYAVKLKPQLLAYTEDGRLEIDNNLAENALRGIAVGRKNWLFAGADCGGERAAAIYSLLETAKLNDVNPQAWLADILDQIGKGHPISRIDELLPWNWTHMRGIVSNSGGK